MICQNCHKRKAIHKEPYGFLPCRTCQKKQHETPSQAREFTTEDIKQQRVEYGQDIIQPHRKGTLSKEWVQQHGIDAAKKRGFSEKEIKKAKNVWSDLSYYKGE